MADNTDALLGEILTKLNQLLQERQALQEPQLYSMRGAATRLGVSYTRMKRLVKSGAVLTVPMVGSLMIPLIELRRIARMGVPKKAGRAKLPPRTNVKAEAAKALAGLRGFRKTD